MDSAVSVKGQGSEIFSAISSVNFLEEEEEEETEEASVENGALICSTTSRSNLKMQPSAPRGNLTFQEWKPATPAAV